MLRFGTLPLGIPKRSVLFFWYASDAKDFFNFFASFLLRTTATVDLLYPSATDTTPGHPYSESSSSEFGLRFFCFFFFFAVAPVDAAPDEAPEAAAAA